MAVKIKLGDLIYDRTFFKLFNTLFLMIKLFSLNILNTENMPYQATIYSITSTTTTHKNDI